jgi:nitrite reductase (NADH) large subunit
LLGLEAANAVLQLGLRTHVAEMAPWLMPVQLDQAGGAALVRHIEGRGVTGHTGVSTEAIEGVDGKVTSLTIADAEPIGTDLVVFSVGIRPQDALARACGLDVAERGGILVDEACRTSDEAIFVGPRTRFVTFELWKRPGWRIPTQLGCWSLKMLNSNEMVRTRA